MGEVMKNVDVAGFGLMKMFGSDMVCLTDMWQAVDGKPHQRPADWRRKEGSEFINHFSKKLNMPENHIFETKRGRGVGGTYAHWQVALAYAKYLSPELHMQVNEVFRGFIEADPKMTANMISRTEDEGALASLGGKVIDKMESEKGLAWVKQRAENKLSTKSLQATIKDVLPTADSFVYRTVMDSNNEAVTGKRAQQIRKERGAKKYQTRDTLTEQELSEMTVLQNWETLVLEKEKANAPSKFQVISKVTNVVDVWLEAKQRLGIAV